MNSFVHKKDRPDSLHSVANTAATSNRVQEAPVPFRDNRPLAVSQGKLIHAIQTKLSSNPVIQAYKITAGPTYEQDDGRAKKSKLTIKTDGKIGKSSANNPAKKTTDKMPGRDKIREVYDFKNENAPFAMHLINGRLGGSGTDWQNLAWGTDSFNRKHYKDWEENIQTQANNKGETIKMSVTANYYSDDKKDKANYYFLRSLNCTHWINGKNQGTIVVTDDDEKTENDPEWKEDEEMSNSGEESGESDSGEESGEMSNSSDEDK